MRRRNAQAFREADDISLVIIRKNDPVKTAAGGFRPADTPTTTLPAQQARIVHNTRRYKNGLVNSEAGDIPDTDYLLLGSHTLDVEVDDEFKWLGDNYKVTGIHPWRTESKLCSIQFSGPDNRG